jgi:hypothetical protein
MTSERSFQPRSGSPFRVARACRVFRRCRFEWSTFLRPFSILASRNIPVEGQIVRIYGLARTVADCFRFRNKVGLNVALEALADAWRGKHLNLDEFRRVATKLRVQRVMRPCLEAIVL